MLLECLGHDIPVGRIVVQRSSYVPGECRKVLALHSGPCKPGCKWGNLPPRMLPKRAKRLQQLTTTSSEKGITSFEQTSSVYEREGVKLLTKAAEFRCQRDSQRGTCAKVFKKGSVAECRVHNTKCQVLEDRLRKSALLINLEWGQVILIGEAWGSSRSGLAPGRSHAQSLRNSWDATHALPSSIMMWLIYNGILPRICVTR